MSANASEENPQALLPPVALIHADKPHFATPQTWRIVAKSAKTKTVHANTATHTMTVNPGKPVVLTGVPAGSTVTISASQQERFPATITQRKPGRWASTPLVPNWTGSLLVETLNGDNWRLKIKTKQAPAVDLRITPEGNSTYGIGMPLTVSSDTLLTPEAKTIVEQNLTLTTGDDTISTTNGTWQWSSETEAQFRPATFWPANSTITATVDLTDIEVMKGLWGNSEAETTLTTGKDNIIVVNLDTYTLTQYVDGKAKAEMKTSGGKAGWETTNGWKIVYEKYDMKRLYNPDPVEGWDVMAPWSMRITTMGEFIHSAPWNPSIGVANTSHGCTNLAVSDAKWLYDRTQIGDPVYTIGGGAVVRSWDGLGGVWNVGADPMPDTSWVES